MNDDLIELERNLGGLLAELQQLLLRLHQMRCPACAAEANANANADDDPFAIRH
jgi:hypothetical protein